MDSYSRGYASGSRNATESGQYAIGVMYVPTSVERAQSINFHGDNELRSGWLAGWEDAIAPFRAFQAREFGVTSAAEWLSRR